MWRSDSPVLEINLAKLQNNTARVVEKCRNLGISVLGVTKGFSAIPEIVAAMAAGGVDGLADSRMENIIEMRADGFRQPMTLLRIPCLSDVQSVIAYATTSLNSELSVIRALAQAAEQQGKIHQIVLMVDVGDLREGVLPHDVLNTVREIMRLKGVALVGIGTNMGCLGGILPEIKNLGLLVHLGDMIETDLGLHMNIISGGGTSTLQLVEHKAVPPEINQLRIGEGILLGTDTTHNWTIPWLAQDAFRIRVEVIEVKAKPSFPRGTIGCDGFGHVPNFEDIGIRNRAIVAIGRQDVYVEGLIPVNKNIKIVGASSDHLVVDITDSEREIQVGDAIEFSPTYSGLLLACRSNYITKVFKEGSV